MRRSPGQTGGAFSESVLPLISLDRTSDRKEKPVPIDSVSPSGLCRICCGAFLCRFYAPGSGDHPMFEACRTRTVLGLPEVVRIVFMKARSGLIGISSNSDADPEMLPVVVVDGIFSASLVSEDVRRSAPFASMASPPTLVGRAWEKQSRLVRISYKCRAILGSGLLHHGLTLHFWPGFSLCVA